MQGSTRWWGYSKRKAFSNPLGELMGLLLCRAVTTIRKETKKPITIDSEKTEDEYLFLR